MILQRTDCPEQLLKCLRFSQQNDGHALALTDNVSCGVLRQHVSIRRGHVEVRVSEHYGLGRTQAELDFVDVDIQSDTAVFVSPRALGMLPSRWGDECVALVQSFFQAVMEAIRGGDHGRAETLLRALREPNETHLGLSSAQSQGRGLGDGSAHSVWSALRTSEAARSGLLQDLEDTILLIPGVSSDIISDMTTNIIREPLIHYTQAMCAQYEIPLIGDVASGPLWDPREKKWGDKYVQLPIAAGNKLLLVPKAIVRQKPDYDAGEYYRHFLLEHLRAVEIEENTALVRLLRNGQKRVTKKDLMAKYGTGKEAIVRETIRYPRALADYRRSKQGRLPQPMSSEALSEVEGQPGPNWDQLVEAVIGTPVGQEGATRYEKAIEALFTALFYPSLTNPIFQFEMHEGRKRVDVTYTNMGLRGFFLWLSTHYPSSHVFIECKNYGREIANPELDQLSGRFSPSRGQVGMLVCRSFQDKQRFLRRCKDTAADHRGFVIALDDEDLQQLVEYRKREPLYDAWPLLRSRFKDLIA